MGFCEGGSLNVAPSSGTISSTPPASSVPRLLGPGHGRTQGGTSAFRVPAQSSEYSASWERSAAQEAKPSEGLHPNEPKKTNAHPSRRAANTEDLKEASGRFDSFIIKKKDV